MCVLGNTLESREIYPDCELYIWFLDCPLTTLKYENLLALWKSGRNKRVGHS